MRALTFSFALLQLNLRFPQLRSLASDVIVRGARQSSHPGSCIPSFQSFDCCTSFPSFWRSDTLTSTGFEVARVNVALHTDDQRWLFYFLGNARRIWNPRSFYLSLRWRLFIVAQEFDAIMAPFMTEFCVATAGQALQVRDAFSARAHCKDIMLLLQFVVRVFGTSDGNVS